MDSIDCANLEELQADARITFVELGRRVGLSTPSVVERVKKLEESKVIVGYHAKVCPDKIGLSMTAIVKVTVSGERVARFAALIAEVPEVLRCHRVTGVESYILHVAVENTAHLACVIDSLMPYVSTNTSIILASPVEWDPFGQESSTRRPLDQGPGLQSVPRSGRVADREQLEKDTSCASIERFMTFVGSTKGSVAKFR